MSPESARPGALPDEQSKPAAIPIHIGRVGVRDVALPILLRQRDCAEPQRTVAKISLSVDLPASARGAHMSRFIEALQELKAEPLDYGAALHLMRKTRKRLGASSAHISFVFPYFLARPAPVSGISALMPYDCALEGGIGAGESSAFSPFVLAVSAPVMTVCPCSKAISEEGAHSQRAEIRIRARMKGHVWIEDLVELAEAAGSSPVYSLLKRGDEKYVTERAFSQPRFVEDVARRAASALLAMPLVASFSVEVESQESIHAHNAFASILEGENLPL